MEMVSCTHSLFGRSASSGLVFLFRENWFDGIPVLYASACRQNWTPDTEEARARIQFAGWSGRRADHNGALLTTSVLLVNITFYSASHLTGPKQTWYDLDYTLDNTRQFSKAILRSPMSDEQSYPSCWYISFHLHAHLHIAATTIIARCLCTIWYIFAGHHRHLPCTYGPEEDGVFYFTNQLYYNYIYNTYSHKITCILYVQTASCKCTRRTTATPQQSACKAGVLYRQNGA
jgi:hypothetical protein